MKARNERNPVTGRPIRKRGQTIWQALNDGRLLTTALQRQLLDQIAAHPSRDYIMAGRIMELFYLPKTNGQVAKHRARLAALQAMLKLLDAIRAQTLELQNRKEASNYEPQ